MFNFFKKKNKGMEVDAVVDGNIMPITDVKDDVFSTKMLGDGYAIKPSDKNIYAPVSGTISTLFPTKHAIGIKTDKGLEILIHLGLDTVELKGAPFTINVKPGDEVKAGSVIGTMDLDAIKKAGKDPVVLTIIANMDRVDHVSKSDDTAVEAGQVVFKAITK